MVGWSEWIGTIGNLTERNHAIAIPRHRYLVSTHRVDWAGIHVDTPSSGSIDEIVSDNLLVEEFRIRNTWPAVRDYVDMLAVRSDCNVVWKLASQWLG